MNILMISRATLFSSPGGDTIQIVSTAKYLEKLNVSVDVCLTSERIDYEKYDLIHFFNIIRPADILLHIKMSNKPYVVSTIFVDYEEYERKARRGLFKILTLLLSSDQQEYLKAIFRSIKNREKIVSSYFLFNGQKRSIKQILKRTSCILPNSDNEKKRLNEKYGIEIPSITIPNAFDTEIFNNNYNPKEAYQNSVICVARIEGLKNQLNLIRALNGTGIKLYIIGKPSPNSNSYYNACRNEAGNNVVFQDHVSQKELASIYRSAKVHAMPSWFETTGLSSLEAAYCGCNIVVTKKGDQEEYFKEFGYFCEPDDIESIKKAVLDAFNAPYDKKVKNYIENNYTWQKTAEKTLNAYKKVLNEK